MSGNPRHLPPRYYRELDPVELPEFDHELDGQYDGDAGSVGAASRMVEYKGAGAGIPWLRGGTPPWHLWGNTQRLDAGPVAAGAVVNPIVETLVRIAYKRPESWNWVFSARLISADNPVALLSTNTIVVSFDVTIGVGRSVIQMPGFEQFRFVAIQPGTFIPGILLRSNTGTGNRLFSNDGAAITEDRLVVDKLVGDNIIVQARVFWTAQAGARCSVEVSAQFAPVNHVRPDWYRQGVPAELVFPGAEVEGQ